MTDYSRQIRLALLILACTVGAAGAQAPHPRLARLEYARDLAALGTLAAARGVPIMLVFTRPDCRYCARAKKDYLEPLGASADYGAKVIVREVEAGNDTLPLRDFDGTLTTHRNFARRREVRMVPTVIVLDARGKPLTDTIVGLSGPDFYGLYLEQAIDTARVQLSARGR